MSMNRDVVVLVGAGVGGTAILHFLLNTPAVEVRCVVDLNPHAPGIELAREHGVKCWVGPCPREVAADPTVDLILEVTGKPEVIHELRQIRHRDCVLVGAAGTKIIFNLLEAQNRITEKLQEHQATLELQIAKRTEELARANEELNRRIIDSLKLNQKLQRINEEKTRYLLQATHQLKAPFAAIQSYADVVIEGFAGEVSAQVLDILQKIRRRCVRLSTAIHDMLELASLKTADEDAMALVPVRLDEVLSATIEQYRDLAQSRNIMIERSLGDDTLETRGNPNQLVTLFSVLLENAIHYSHDGSNVEVSARRVSEEEVSVSIADRGIGIPPENIPKIFTEYFRSNNAAAKNENGSGLGLAIAKEIANRHAFTILVASRLEEGSTFTVKMPSLEAHNGVGTGQPCSQAPDRVTAAD
jgi:two-component system, OmpR family, sensor kinase